MQAVSLLDMPNDDDFSVGKTLHPFEEARLGRAPFRCVGVTDTGAFGNASCRYCGHDIRYAYHVRDITGAQFDVGSDCVARTGLGDMAGFADTKRKFDREARAAAKVRKAARMAEEWRGLNKDEAAWIEREAANGFGFAKAMQVALVQWGSLTFGQTAAIRKCIAGSEQRQVQASAQRTADVARVESAKVVDITRIETAFTKAFARGLQAPKMHLAHFVFKPARKDRSMIYVTRDETYLGKIADGKFIRSRECVPEDEAKVLEVCAAPDEAATAYGRSTGRCAICSRVLTNEESVARAIGPICAENMGW